jgi:ABC-type antimicrobial peptide transport system permease subunit
VAPAPFGGVTEPPQPELFFSSRQWDSSVSELVCVVRTAADPATLAPTLRAMLRDEDPSLAIDSLMTMDERMMNSLARPRTYAVLIGGFALFAVLVAAVGLYGTMSHMTAQRTREIGVRAALGARPRDILRLVTTDAAAVTLGGLALGLAGAFLLARALRSLIYGISTHDAASFIAVPVVLLVVVAMAWVVPAWRATRVSPLVALRDG